jgi:outer membrane protein
MKNKIYFLGIIGYILSVSVGYSQDKLSIDTAIARVIRTHPGIARAQAALEVAGARINLAEAGYYPMVDAGASYSRIGPVAKFDIPGFGVIKIYPEDNYSVSVNFRQMLYDFGRTAKSIGIEKANKVLAEKGLELSRQYLAIATTSSFYTLYFINQALIIKDDQLSTLNEHLSFIEKMKETGSATEFEILTTRVKISAIESQKVDLISMQTTQTSILNSLLGLPYNNLISLEVNLETISNEFSPDSLLNFALENRNEIQLAKQQEEIARLQIQFEKAKNNPSFNAFVSGGAKNGYVPDLYKFQPNFVAGVNFSVPIFDGYRERNNVLIAQAKISSAEFELENEARTVTDEVIQAESDTRSTFQKIRQYGVQVEQADQALKLAGISYKAGTITNLDMLMAETSAAESRLMLLKSKVDYQLSLAKLKMVSGQRLY